MVQLMLFEALQREHHAVYFLNFIYLYPWLLLLGLMSIGVGAWLAMDGDRLRIESLFQCKFTLATQSCLRV